MIWVSSFSHPEGRSFQIEWDWVLGTGFYFFVHDKDERCTHDHLQDTFQATTAQAYDDFGVPKDTWQKLRFPLFGKIAAIFRVHDLSDLICNGAPEDEYDFEAGMIACAIARAKPADVTEEFVFSLVRAAWAKMFCLEEERLARMDASFRKIAFEILS